ncbi:MAG: UDP-N-acetylglucosamine 2-epimerase [Elusimicrobiota bacterium]|nr:UDP-N-acetylglucosamine 2-epimerase [Elusimicrobiota bacterium]
MGGPRLSRKVCVVTTSRAEYGLLEPVARAIAARRGLRLQLVVSGSHLSRAFGRTERAIRLPIAARIPMPAGDDAASQAKAVGRAVGSFAAAFARLRPDLLVLLGDRYELLAPATAAVALKIPIAHLHGGEASEGVIDEQVRHALTKLSYLHFVAAEPYRRRVIAMGEDPRRVFLSGAPGLENAAGLKPLPDAELSKLVGLPLTPPPLVVTYHPCGKNPLGELDGILSAVAASGRRAVFTFAGADAGGRAVNARLKAFASRDPRRYRVHASLGARGWLSLLRRAAACVGNSSSGVIEAPLLRVPTVNAGARQDGRLKAPSVVDCAPSAAAVSAALRRVLSPSFRSRLKGRSPYRGGAVAERIAAVLATADLAAAPRKTFHGGRA